MTPRRTTPLLVTDILVASSKDGFCLAKSEHLPGFNFASSENHDILESLSGAIAFFFKETRNKAVTVEIGAHPEQQSLANICESGALHPAVMRPQFEFA